MNTKKKIRPIIGILCFLMALFVTSCVDGYKDDNMFSSEVKNAQLVSPDGSKVKITTENNAKGEEEIKVDWSVVYGAGGYEFSLYNVDDPDNPIPVGEENEFIDGCSARRIKQEDTKYKVVIKSLGDEKLNNKSAISATEIAYSTLVPLYAIIPDGSDLGTYFAANPVQPLEKGVTEIAYELVAGGEYTMSSNVALDTVTMTIRGDKVNRAKIKMSTGSFISDGAGIKFKFIDFDCSEFKNDAVLMFNSTLNPNKISSDWVTVTSPVGFQSCDVKDLAKKLIWDNSKKYGLQTILIKDCIIEMNTSSNMQMVHMAGGFIKDTQITTSTFYNKQINGNYWIQYNSSRVDANKEWTKDPYNWLKAGISVTNCTFYQIAKSGQICNYAGLIRPGNYIILTHNIFVDCGKKEVVYRFTSDSPNMNNPRTFGYNTYWYDGAFIEDELISASKANRDNSGTAIKDDPRLKNPQNGDFTVVGAAQVAARTGDPRWLPVQ